MREGLAGGLCPGETGTGREDEWVEPFSEKSRASFARYYYYVIVVVAAAAIIQRREGTISGGGEKRRFRDKGTRRRAFV